MHCGSALRPSAGLLLLICKLRMARLQPWMCVGCSLVPGIGHAAQRTLSQGILDLNHKP